MRLQLPFINRTLDNKPIRELLLEYKADVVEGIEDATDEVGRTAYHHHSDKDWARLLWSSPLWSGVVWSGSVWRGTVWSGLVWAIQCWPEGIVRPDSLIRSSVSLVASRFFFFLAQFTGLRRLGYTLCLSIYWRRNELL